MEGNSRVVQLGTLLESKNRGIRQEAANTFANFSPSDQKTRQILVSHLASQSWEARVSSAEALGNMLKSLPILNNVQCKTEPAEELKILNLPELIRTYKPLLSAGTDAIDERAKVNLSSIQQRRLIDQHLDLSANTGLSSKMFLDDAEVLPSSAADSPKPYDQGDELKPDMSIKDELSSLEGSHSLDDMETRAVCELTKSQVFSLADVRWQNRHGAALSISKILSTSWNRLPLSLIDACALRLLQVLALDRFNDFVSGRSASAPVRESAAQAVAHYIHRSDSDRRSVIMDHLRFLLDMNDDKLWVCRQSALLVMKYYFVIAEYGIVFEEFFELVVGKLKDSVDDVVSAAVTSLSSLFANDTIKETKKEFVDRVMEEIWTLLHIESKKEQLRSGLDALAMDLLSIVFTWLREDETATISRERLLTVVDLIDAQFRSRTQLCVQLIATALERGLVGLDGKDAFSLLKIFYRVMLFAPPSDSTILFEEIYLTAVRLMQVLRLELLNEPELSRNIGLWIGCLMYDHRNPVIDVISYCVEGPSSAQADPGERMCSEEMRFLSDPEKDAVYITRKILAAKFLAPLLQMLYESKVELNGQSMSTALQLVLIPSIQSTSLYQNLGASIVINEWAQLYKATVSRNIPMESPMMLISVCDQMVRCGQKNFDELTSSVMQLTADCNEFVDYCCIRGANRDSIYINDSASVEEVAKFAYDQCRNVTTGEKALEAVDSRYKVLCDWIDFTKIAIRANSNRVFALLASSLFNFGVVGEKMTPLVRPLVETMQSEENETVSTEIYKSAVPLLVIYSWQRNPRPYVKVIAKTIEIYGDCEKRIPRASSELGLDPSSILSYDSEEAHSPSAASKNAQLLLTVCCSFAVEQLPEFYAHFDLDSDMDDDTFLTRLELHGSLWTRVGSRLSDKATQRVFAMLCSSSPELRFAAAKAISTFAASCLSDTINRCCHRLTQMVSDLDRPDARRGAIEVLLRLSRLGASLVGVVCLLAPVVFPRLADPLLEVRDAAGETFRNMVPLLALEKIPTSIPAGLSDDLVALVHANSSFINVLSQPSSLPAVKQDDIEGLKEGINLRNYQLEGITWMQFLRKFGLNGILADDMGLGKTLQTLTVLAMGMQNKTKGAARIRPSLIVCPRTLVDHWCNEWKRWFPTHRKALKAEGAVPEQLQSASIVVTAYEDLKGNRLLSKIAWNYVILDEGHILRNPRTAVWKAANELISQSRLILSGTPVQNSPADLWSLFTWLMPGYLGEEKSFRVQFLKAIHKCRSPKATEQDMQNGQDALARLHKLILPFVMRRLKKDVLPELPDKVVQDYECQLSPAQRQLYKIIADRCTTDRKTLERGVGLSPLHALIALRKVVDHPCLIRDVVPRLELPESLLPLVEFGESGKMAALGELLSQCGIGGDTESETDKDSDDELSNLDMASVLPHRALIFCQWRTSVQLVSHYLTKGLGGGQPVSHLVLDGSVAPGERQGIVDRFNSDHSIDVLLLTTHIGGVGLNLTGADVVIFMDHDWNPMKDLQAIDRAHRLGQTRKVVVYRLITQGTIEEKVMGYQKFKQNTADALIGSDNRSLQSMATDELMGLFTLEQGEEKETKNQGPKAKKAKIEHSFESGEDSRWNLSELWDESQYEETSDVHAFAREARQAKKV